MVKILGWEIKRIRIDEVYDRCDVCGAYSYTHTRVPVPTQVVRGVNVCHRCRCNEEVRHCLDLEYWHEHPEDVPACRNCGKTVPPEQLQPAVLRDWYFCPECKADPEVIRHHEELLEQMPR